MPKTKKEKEHLNKIADFGCIICYLMGFPKSPCQVHHIRHKTGLSRRESHFKTIGLCLEHHTGKTGFHTNSKLFNEKWGSQEELLKLNLKLIGGV